MRTKNPLITYAEMFLQNYLENLGLSLTLRIARKFMGDVT